MQARVAPAAWRQNVETVASVMHVYALSGYRKQEIICSNADQSNSFGHTMHALSMVQRATYKAAAAPSCLPSCASATKTCSSVVCDSEYSSICSSSRAPSTAANSAGRSSSCASACQHMLKLLHDTCMHA